MAAAEKTPKAEAPAPASTTTYLETAPEVDEVTLYNREGKERKLTDPSAIVQAEFNGWSRNKKHVTRKRGAKK